MHPVVYRGVAGAGVESQHRIAIYISDIGHAADVDHHERARRSPDLRASAA